MQSGARRDSADDDLRAGRRRGCRLDERLERNLVLFTEWRRTHKVCEGAERVRDARAVERDDGGRAEVVVGDDDVKDSTDSRKVLEAGAELLREVRLDGQIREQEPGRERGRDWVDGPRGRVRGRGPKCGFVCEVIVVGEFAERLADVVVVVEEPLVEFVVRSERARMLRVQP